MNLDAGSQVVCTVVCIAYIVNNARSLQDIDRVMLRN